MSAHNVRAHPLRTTHALRYDEDMETETATPISTPYAVALAAFDAAQAKLAAMATPDLLRAAHALTHRIHVGEGRGRRSRPMTEAEVRDLRHQRDMIDAEILRRADR